MRRTWIHEAETLSPAAKYEKAFNLQNLADTVSAAYGVDSVTWAKTCTANDQCDRNQGEFCAKREGKSEGRCIPGWFGLCHAWAPSAILAPEPQKDVTVNGVTFKVNDLKALLTYVYNRVETRFLSQRCEASTSLDTLPLDANGRPLDATGARPEGGTKQEFKGTGTQYEEKILGPFDVEPGTMLMAEMKVNKGDGEFWEIQFYSNEPDDGESVGCYSLSAKSRSCLAKVPANLKKALVRLSSRTNDFEYLVNVFVNAKVSTQYAFNGNAKKLLLVRTTSRYISESGHGDRDNLASRIDQFTSADEYSYILELNGKGEIIGGEWAGDSRLGHPDFLWLPIQQSAAEVNGISYEKVRDLVKQSLGQ